MNSCKKNALHSRLSSFLKRISASGWLARGSPLAWMAVRLGGGIADIMAMMPMLGAGPPPAAERLLGGPARAPATFNPGIPIPTERRRREISGGGGEGRARGGENTEHATHRVGRGPPGFDPEMQTIS